MDEGYGEKDRFASLPGIPDICQADACAAKAARLISATKDEAATSHGSFFRERFGRRALALDFLRHHLPAEPLAETDLATPETIKSGGHRGEQKEHGKKDWKNVPDKDRSQWRKTTDLAAHPGRRFGIAGALP